MNQAKQVHESSNHLHLDYFLLPLLFALPFLPEKLQIAHLCLANYCIDRVAAAAVVEAEGAAGAEGAVVAAVVVVVITIVHGTMKLNCRQANLRIN